MVGFKVNNLFDFNRKHWTPPAAVLCDHTELPSPDFKNRPKRIDATNDSVFRAIAFGVRLYRPHRLYIPIPMKRKLQSLKHLLRSSVECLICVVTFNLWPLGRRLLQFHICNQTQRLVDAMQRLDHRIQRAFDVVAVRLELHDACLQALQ